MARNTAPSTTQAVRAVVEAITPRVPAGWSAKRVRSPGRGRGEPALLRLRSPEGDAFDFEIVRVASPTPRSLTELVDARSTSDRLLVVSSYLSPRAREVLEERRVSYGDATGNIKLVSDEPPLWMEAVGASSNPWSSTQRLQSLRGRSAARAVRAVTDFTPPFGVRELSEKSAVPLGTVSRVIDLLDREALITRKSRGPVTDVDVAGVIQRWTQDYDFSTSNRVVSHLEPRGVPTLRDKLSKATWRYAATGSFAAQEFAPIAPARLGAIFVDDVVLAAEKLGVTEVESGANLLLIEPFDEVVFERTLQRDDLVVVSPSQLAADLLTGPGRAPSEGEELLRWMEENEDAWRA